MSHLFITIPGDESSIRLPAHHEVCGRCAGTGTHCNPSIDGNGITSEEWADWSEEEQESYFSGAYDVTCEECGGKRVVLVPDVDAFTPEQTSAWRSHCEDAAEAATERRWRAAGIQF